MTSLIANGYSVVANGCSVVAQTVSQKTNQVRETVRACETVSSVARTVIQKKDQACEIGRSVAQTFGKKKDQACEQLQRMGGRLIPGRTDGSSHPGGQPGEVDSCEWEEDSGALPVGNVTTGRPHSGVQAEKDACAWSAEFVQSVQGEGPLAAHNQGKERPSFSPDTPTARSVSPSDAEVDMADVLASLALVEKKNAAKPH